jgi:glc operon protein GlcG
MSAQNRFGGWVVTITVKALTLPMARKMADAAEAVANEKNLKVVIAIMDQHGNLKYFRRMDGNNLVSVRMAQLKALTCASIGQHVGAIGVSGANPELDGICAEAALVAIADDLN